MADKKRNILFISGWYPSRVEPFLGNFVEKHAEAVALDSNVAVLHACSDPQLSRKRFEHTVQTIKGVLTVHVYFKKVRHRIPVISQLQKLFRYKKAHRIGLRILEENGWNYDLVHLNILWPAGLIAQEIKRDKGIPYIITEHSTAYQPRRKYERSRIERMYSKGIAKNAACITPVSLDLQQAMQRSGLEGTYTVVNNVVDTALFTPKEKKAGENKFRFLHISTLIDEHKNVSGMIRAAAALYKDRSDFEFHIVGDGVLAPHIAYAKKLGVLEKPVFFGGPQSTAEVAALMRDADCLVLFSNYENLPVVIIEAFAAGIPVISTRIGGIPEQINESRGILIDAGNEKGLEKALAEMMAQCRAAKYDPAALHTYAVENFSREKVSKQFHLIYERALQNNG